MSRPTARTGTLVPSRAMVPRQRRRTLRGRSSYDAWRSRLVIQRRRRYASALSTCSLRRAASRARSSHVSLRFFGRAFGSTDLHMRRNWSRTFLYAAFRLRAVSVGFAVRNCSRYSSPMRRYAIASTRLRSIGLPSTARSTIDVRSPSTVISVCLRPVHEVLHSASASATPLRRTTFNAHATLPSGTGSSSGGTGGRSARSRAASTAARTSSGWAAVNAGAGGRGAAGPRHGRRGRGRCSARGSRSGT